MTERVGLNNPIPHQFFGRTNFELVKEFHAAFSPDQNTPDRTSMERINLRLDLIEEEVTELYEAFYDDQNIDWVAVADALGDILYVVNGAGLAFGIDLDKVFAEIHRSNMTKLGPNGKPLMREDGKILKGPNYDPPHLEDIVNA